MNCEQEILGGFVTRSLEPLCGQWFHFSHHVEIFLVGFPSFAFGFDQLFQSLPSSRWIMFSWHYQSNYFLLLIQTWPNIMGASKCTNIKLATWAIVIFFNLIIVTSLVTWAIYYIFCLDYHGRSSHTYHFVSWI